MGKMELTINQLLDLIQLNSLKVNVIISFTHPAGSLVPQFVLRLYVATSHAYLSARRKNVGTGVGDEMCFCTANSWFIHLKFSDKNVIKSSILLYYSLR